MPDRHVIVFPAPARVELQRAPRQPPGPGEVELRTIATLMSPGTELTALQRRFDDNTHWAAYVQYPFRPGYACLATVGETGPDVTGLATGQRVVCRSGHASHHTVPAVRCTPVPDDVSDDQAVWFALAKIAFVGVRAAALRLGDDVLIAGAGPVGQMACRWAAASGVAECIVLDLSEERLRHAEAGGATITIPRPLDAAISEIGTRLPHRPGVLIDCTGNPQILPIALQAVADYGRVVLLGDPGSPASQHLASDLTVRGLSIVGAHDNHTETDPRWDHDRVIHRLFLRLAAAGRFPLDGLITHRFTPDRATAAYRQAGSGDLTPIGTLFDWSQPLD